MHFKLHDITVCQSRLPAVIARWISNAVYDECSNSAFARDVIRGHLHALGRQTAQAIALIISDGRSTPLSQLSISHGGTGYVVRSVSTSQDTTQYTPKSLTGDSTARLWGSGL